MKYFIKICLSLLISFAFYNTAICSHAPHTTPPTIKSCPNSAPLTPQNTTTPPIHTPLTITNSSDKPVTIQIDIRVDYYYTHASRKTFLPACKVNLAVTINPHATATIPIPLPQGLHEPYNSIKKSLRAKKYEHSDTTIRGVIMIAHDPKKFQRIKTSLRNKESLALTI